MAVPVLVAVLIPLFPLAAFVLSVSVTRRRPAASAGLSIAAVGVSFLLSAWVLGGQLAASGPVQADTPWLVAGVIHISMGILVDQLSSLMLVIITTVSLLVQI